MRGETAIGSIPSPGASRHPREEGEEKEGFLKPGAGAREATMAA